MDTQNCLKQAKETMNATVAHFDKELQKVRAGKASPQMLDGIKVDYYGNPTPIDQVANVNTPDAHQIVIQPWERNMLPVIEKAILAANIGVTPQNNGEFIRLVVPAPTEERRKELCKAAKTEIENAKVNIRNVRRNVMDKVKKLKDKSVPEDEVKQVEKELQDITDKNIAECDKIYAAKEKEIMSI